MSEYDEQRSARLKEASKLLWDNGHVYAAQLLGEMAMDDIPEANHDRRKDTDRNTGAARRPRETPGQEPAQAVPKETRHEDGSVGFRPSEALGRVREELQSWHFKYPEKDRGGFGRTMVHLTDAVESLERRAHERGDS